MNEIIYTILIAMAPISELRGAIPIAISVYHMSWQSALFWSVLGNMIPVVFILWLLGPFVNWLGRKIPRLGKWINNYFEHTKNKHAKKIEVYKELALVILVAIPLPLTGAWTGALVAYLFGLPYKKALPLIFLGVLIAGIIVTLVSMGFLNIQIFIKH